MNTGKVAKVMAETMNATLKKVGEVRPEELAGYDLVGIGSGSLFRGHACTSFCAIFSIMQLIISQNNKMRIY
jgi:flavodoxin